MPHQCRKARSLLISLTTTAAAFWAAGSAAFPVLHAYALIIISAGMTVTIIDAMVVITFMIRDRDKELLLNCLVEASQRAAKAPTVPLHVVRKAR